MDEKEVINMMRANDFIRQKMKVQLKDEISESYLEKKIKAF